jgi:glycosyltransferase 2 family protein
MSRFFTEKMPSWTRKRAFVAVRLLAGIALLALLISRMDLARFFESTCKSSLWLLAAATGIVGLRMFLAAERWRLASGPAARGLSIGRFFSWYMEANFFNIFLPSQGGDLVRAWRFGAAKGDGAVGLSSVVAERMLGLAGTVLLALCGVLLSPPAKSLPGATPSIFVSVLLTVFGFVLLFHPSASRGVVRFSRRMGWQKASEFACRFSQAFAALARRPMVLIGILFYSIAVQLAGILAIYLIGIAISIPISFSYYLLAVPVVWLAVMIPVSLNGIGTREAANIAILGAVGVAAESALLLSVIWSGQLLLLGLIGAGFHVALTAAEAKPKPRPAGDSSI